MASGVGAARTRRRGARRRVRRRVVRGVGCIVVRLVGGCGIVGVVCG